MVLAGAAAFGPGARAQTGFLGLEIMGADDSRALAALGPAFKGGVLVKDVAVGEPAAVAGFRRGDVIVEFNGTKTATIDDLLQAVARTKPDQRITIVVMRAGARTELTLRTVPRPPAWSVTTSMFHAYPELGFTVAGISEEARKQFALPWGAVGLVVTTVDDKGPVGSGLKAGDVIVQANLRDVWDPRQLTREIDEARKNGKSHVLMLISNPTGYRYSALPVK
jgi:S1-C subfamily serine protease